MSGSDPGFSTPTMAAIFTTGRKVAGLLSFEAGLAEASAELGLIPTEVAREIVRACAGFDGDPEEILRSGWERGTPLIPLLDSLRSGLSREAGAALHRGATSQDAIDTGLIGQIREAGALLGSESRKVADHLARLAEIHRHTSYLARTLLQQALPSTFGHRASQWLDQVERANAGLAAATDSLPVQLGGPVGVASTEPGGQELVEQLAARLDLVAPARSWHTNRSYVRRPLAAALEVALAMEKIAFDLALLASYGEVSMRRGESSSMEHKRNPIDAIRSVASARACVAAASALAAAGGHELERGIGGSQVEWWAVPSVFETAAAAVDGVNSCLAHLEINR